MTTKETLSTGTTLLPWVVALGGGVIAYKYLKGDVSEFLGGLSGGGSVVEYVGSAVQDAAEAASDAVKETVYVFTGDPNAESKNEDIKNALSNGLMSYDDALKKRTEYKKNEDASKNIVEKTTESASDWLKLSDRPIGNWLLGNGLFTKDASKSNPSGGLNLNWGESQKSIYVGNMNASDAFLAGLESAPLSIWSGENAMTALGVSPSNVSGSTPSIDTTTKNETSAKTSTKASTKTSTKRSSSGSVQRAATASDIKASGMPVSNLKNAKSVTVGSDGRINIRYKQGADSTRHAKGLRY